MKKTILTQALFILALFLNQAAWAQPCNNSQPVIVGPQEVCPGAIYTYCAEGDTPNYTSYEWDVPRAHAGDPPTGWVIISGQGTRCVTVQAGTKSGTMKVKVNHTECGTKVATLPVQPRADAPEANVTGPEFVCSFEDTVTYTTPDQGFKANNGKGSTWNNGKGHGSTPNNSSFTYTWTVPSDWIIVSGQGTSSLQVVPGIEPGYVAVDITGNSCGTAADSMYVTPEDCGGLNPLPVELTSFDGASTPEGIVLNWTTASEKDNDFFDIERSTDGETFEAIAQVDGAGTINTARTYKHNDTKPAAGINYYRLKQVDFDGTTEYSKVIAVEFGKTNEAAISMTMYPNPVIDGNLNISAPQLATLDQNAEVQIFDLNGRLIYSKRVENGVSEINLSLPALGVKQGMYMVGLKTGTKVNFEKIVVR
ncbi:MAG: T9SS type A sorting domain-containing protein [Hymenobacteraceae bacterium]|nr:T9SS type A sorting domain-containing protein [Hymenobacteraceae bacterium]MDX5395358.1 T9SS type A sorting domain-containing protein [Hymenobacteraceae bacterium]MDX5443269.1 T9SS type A sorting domain-containing protein [Hymenobacteraceae bacterium]MDX5511409.1 T9SS type A sorting domain-containing protein [Hymenobacteraceae bacterium]